MHDHHKMQCPFQEIKLPANRLNPLDPPPELIRLSQEKAIHRLMYPDGHLGWLVTSYEMVRKILTDPRFSALSEFKRAPILRPGVEPFYGQPALPGWLVDMDPPEHTRYRKALSNLLSMKRMKELKPRIEQIVQDHLDIMARMDFPVDLVKCFALPVPSLMICELLGVPYEARNEFQRNSAILFSLEVSADESTMAMKYLTNFLNDLVRHKRKYPEEDLLSELIALNEFNDEEISGIGVLLLTAGHETTANMLALGTFTLLSHQKELQLLRNNPSLIENTVEELLRYLTIFHFGVPRTPLEDIELEGVLIKAGDSVILSVSAANRDPAQFEDAQMFSIERSARGHFAFGFGIHYCLGINLARSEMQVAYMALFQRFPKLHLAVCPQSLKFSTDAGLYGLHHLPVAW